MMEKSPKCWEAGPGKEGEVCLQSERWILGATAVFSEGKFSQVWPDSHECQGNDLGAQALQGLG